MKQTCCDVRGIMKFARQSALMLVIAMIWGCSSTTNNVTQLQQNKVTQMQQNNGAMIQAPVIVDKRTDGEIERLLPANTFNQQEFPKPFVISMMRVCIIKNNNKNPSNPIAQANKADPFCSCLTNERVHHFTMSEFLDVDSAEGKPSPELARRNHLLKSQCLQQVLK